MDFQRHTSKDVSGYSKMIHDMRWNREGNYIGIVSADKTVKVGQLDKSGSFQNVHSIPNSGLVSQIGWNPLDDSRIGMCGDDKSVELWDVRASRASAKLSSLGNNISFAWSPCGNCIAVGNKSDTVSVLDLRRNALFKRKKFSYEVNDLVWTANSGFLLAATGNDGVGSLDVLSITDADAPADAPSTTGVSELHVVGTVAAHVSNCVALRVDSGMRRLAVGGLDHCVSFWELDDLVCQHTVAVEGEVRSMSFSGDGRYLAVTAEDPTITICDAESGEAVARVAGRQRLNAVAWHPKQALLCVATEDRLPSPQYLRFLSFAENSTV